MALIHYFFFFVISSLISYCDGRDDTTMYAVNLTEAAEKHGAVCMDGSQGRYYFAWGKERTKYVTYLQGGAYCAKVYEEYGPFQSCWERRNDHHGSTLNDSATRDMNSGGSGWLSNNCTRNPLFCDWNKIYLRYCDQASFSGDLEYPIYNDSNNKSEPIYFRGKRILDGFFEDLIKNYKLNDATEFVFGGGSAGAWAIFIHANYVADKYFNLSKTKLVGLADDGWFLEYNGWNGMTNFSNAMQWIFDEQNVSSSIVSPACFNNPNLTNAECIFPPNVAKDLKIPVFITNSEYDQAQADDVLGTANKNATLLNEYGQNFTNILLNKFLINNKENNYMFGAFIDSCYHHGPSNTSFWYDMYIDGYNQQMAFQQFYKGLDEPIANNKLQFWYQNMSYPCPNCCPSSAYLKM